MTETNTPYADPESDPYASLLEFEAANGRVLGMFIICGGKPAANDGAVRLWLHSSIQKAAHYQWIENQLLTAVTLNEQVRTQAEGRPWEAGNA